MLIYKHFQFQPFLATNCKKVAQQKLDANEDIEVAVLPIPAWVAGVESGAIRTDAKSMAITFLALRKLDRKSGADLV